jgi:ketosteroid isomerase-like protein
MEGDAAAAVGCFSPQGRLLTPDGTEVAGRAAVSSVLAQLVGSEVRLEIRHGRTISSAGIALATQFWKRSAPQDGAERFEQASRATLVLGQEPTGWTIMIASPWG